MNYINRFYPESTLTGFSFTDGTIAFYQIINYLINNNPEDVTLLDVGCGRGAYLDEQSNSYKNHMRNFKGRVKKVIGIDIDPEAATNKSINEFYLLDTTKPWPIESASVDLCLCDFVVEHVKDIDHFFSEIQRVLKKDGWVSIRTSNALGYVGLISRIIPNDLHSKVLKKVQKNRKEIDVFPAVYKCNTVSRITRMLKEYNLNPYVFTHEPEPTYFSFSIAFYYLGVIYQKMAPKILRNAILAFGQKK